MAFIDLSPDSSDPFRQPLFLHRVSPKSIVFIQSYKNPNLISGKKHKTNKPTQKNQNQYG